MCGLPCSGKTTLARHIERESGAIRLTADEWMLRQYGAPRSLDEIDTVRSKVEDGLIDLAVLLLSQDLDVIADFGPWSRDDRERFRSLIADAGARSELHFVDVPYATLASRLNERNARWPEGPCRIDEKQLRRSVTLFERPTSDELKPREPQPAF
jgi:predicted kinase